MNENELRDRIGGAFGVEPPSSGFESRMLAALTSPPPRRTVAVRWPLEVAGGSIAVLVVVALTLAHVMVGQAPTAGPLVNQPGVVPWADLPAPNVAQPFTKPGVPACRAAQLVIDVQVADPSYVGAGPKDTSFWAIDVTNSSQAECFVGPTMDIAFTTAQGPLKAALVPWPGDVVYLSTGARAVGEIDMGPCAEPRITQMQISPGQGLGSVSLDPGPAGGFGTPCPQKPQTYFVELYTDANQVGYLPATGSAMQAPASAHPGERLRFTVTVSDVNQWFRGSHIANSSPPPTLPLVWSPCPSYHIELEGVAGTFHTYTLNCAQANTIPPNGSETFEMFIDVPRDAKPGPATLVWSIDGSPQQWQRASAFVPIES